MIDLVVHRAKWVVPVVRPIVENGAVMVSGNQIADVGSFEEIDATGARINDHGEAVLMPGLVNVHTHLELSAFRELGKIRDHEGFIDWVRKLLDIRFEMEPETIGKSYEEALEEISSFGTVAIGDIGNDFNYFARLENFQGAAIYFFEVLGFAAQSLAEALGGHEDVKRLVESGAVDTDEKPSFQLGAHAVYSTSPQVIYQVKKWNSQNCRRMTIHVAENRDEVEFLMTGKGSCRELLEERGQWNKSWKIPECSPVKYLKELGVLDEFTICVHLVFIDEKDLSVLSECGVPVAICPRSNLFLTGKLPPVEKFVEYGLTCGIGTDSLASSSDLNLFSDMQVLINELGLDPKLVLEMSTLGGAKVLGIEDKFGSLEKGKVSSIIKIPVRADSGDELFYEVISRGMMGEVEWVN